MAKREVFPRKAVKKGKPTGTITILSAPSESDLRPNEHEKRLLQDLFNWQKRSAQSHWVLGQARSFSV
jgi:hypothetical protein